MLQIEFPHGLGDCVHFAHQIPLYTRRGHRFTIACDPDKRIVFAASGVEVTSDVSGADRVVCWHEGTIPNGEARWNNAWRWSKAAGNISAPPMPAIGTPEDLWEEYCNVRLNIWPYLPAEAHASAGEWLRDLARPVILLHTHGNSYALRKGLTNEQCWQLYRSLLEETNGTLVLLDWDNRTPRLAHERIRHLGDDWMPVDTAQLLALIGRADLMIGVDSGPLHAGGSRTRPRSACGCGVGLPPPGRCRGRCRSTSWWGMRIGNGAQAAFLSTSSSAPSSGWWKR